MTDTLPQPSALQSGADSLAIALPSGVGRSHGTSGSEPFDRWFRYPAGFASDHVEHLLGVLGLKSGTVLDCFAGSGVTGTAARNQGLGFYGIEAHPMIAELASVKLTVPSTAVDQLVDLAAEVADRARSAPEPVGEEAPPLVLRSFDPGSLALLRAVRREILERDPDELSVYLKWALLGTLRDVAAVKVGWPYQLPAKSRRAPFSDPVARFSTRVGWMAEDIAGLGEDPRPDAAVRLGDSRQEASWPVSPAQACIASPPYLNNFDYADATRLEAYFWGEASSWKQLTTSIRGDMLTASTQQSTVREAAEAMTTLSTVPETLATVQQLTAALAEQRDVRGGRTKQYHQVLPAYFAAMQQILTHLRSALDPGAVTLWQVGDSAPYGVHVDTPAVILALASELGFQTVSDTAIRSRGNRWRRADNPARAQLTERIIAFRR